MKHTLTLLTALVLAPLTTRRAPRRRRHTEIQNPQFPRPPIFVTSFAKASSYAKASADKTAVRKATTGRPVWPPAP